MVATDPVFAPQLPSSAGAPPCAENRSGGNPLAHLPKAAQGTFDELLAGVEPDLAAIARSLRAMIREVDVNTVATVRLGDNAATRTRQISGDSGTHSQNSLEAEFGLGAATLIDSIVVRWPSGIVWDTSGVAVDQRIEIVEREISVGGASS